VTNYISLFILAAQFYILISSGPYTNFEVQKNLTGIIELLLSTLETIGATILTLPRLFVDSQPSLNFAILALIIGFIAVTLCALYIIRLSQNSNLKSLVLKLPLLVFCLFSISFNEFQWNLNSSKGKLSFAEMLSLIRNDAFTTSWKYKLQYHIIDYSFFVIIFVYIVSKIRFKALNKSTLLAILILLILSLTPSYFSKASDPTVAVKWDPTQYLTENGEQVCFPINPLADWDYQVNPVLSQGWLIGGCSSQWMDLSKHDGNLMGSNSGKVIESLLSKEPAEYRNLVLYVDRQPHTNTTGICVSRELHPGYISPSYWTRSGYRYILFGFSKSDSQLISSGKPIMNSCDSKRTISTQNWKYEFIFPGI